MRRPLFILFMLVLATPALAMRQGAPPMPKVTQPSGWPLVGYLIAGLLFTAAITLSLKGSNRTDPETGEIS